MNILLSHKNSQSQSKNLKSVYIHGHGIQIHRDHHFVFKFCQNFVLHFKFCFCKLAVIAFK